MEEGEKMERATGIEPATCSLENCHSTIELRPQFQSIVRLLNDQTNYTTLRLAALTQGIRCHTNGSP